MSDYKAGTQGCSSKVVNPPTMDEQIAGICDRLDKMGLLLQELIQMQMIVAGMPRLQRYAAMSEAKAGVTQ